MPSNFHFKVTISRTVMFDLPYQLPHRFLFRLPRPKLALRQVFVLPVPVRQSDTSVASLSLSHWAGERGSSWISFRVAAPCLFIGQGHNRPALIRDGYRWHRIVLELGTDESRAGNKQTPQHLLNRFPLTRAHTVIISISPGV